MGITTTQIEELRERYRTARQQIDQLAGLEHDVGLAALRLEATATYSHVVTTASGTPDEVLAPLKEYVAHLQGGEQAERAIAALRRQAGAFASSVTSSIVKSYLGGALIGILAVIVGLWTRFAVTADQLGRALFGAIIGGGAVAGMVLNMVRIGGGAAQSGASKGWGWARALGVQSDRALTSARVMQQQLWTAAGGGRPTTRPFTERARLTASVLVGLTIVLLSIAAVLVVLGIWHAFEAQSNQPIRFGR